VAAAAADFAVDGADVHRAAGFVVGARLVVGLQRGDDY
jgi:hypothetical protein